MTARAAPRVAPLRRCSAMDTALLAVDRPPVTMNIGSLLVFERLDADADEIAGHLGRRLDRAPRLRQRLVVPPPGGGRPVWVDDDRFDVRSHVRRIGLGGVGGAGGADDPDAVEAALLELFALVQSIPLDRTRPLWELWVVDLPDGRSATLQKIHHALADGVSDVDILMAMLDLTGDAPSPDTPAPRRPARPAAPSGAQLVTDAAGRRLRGAASSLRHSVTALRHPVSSLDSATAALRALGAAATAVARPAPPSSLNGRIGSQRRFAVVRYPLAPARALAHRRAVSVNDVVTAAVSLGLGTLLRHRGDDVTGLRLQAVVPVTVRRGAAMGGTSRAADPDNRFVPVRIGLPVDADDPLACLFDVHRQMFNVKRSKGLAGGAPLLDAVDAVPSSVIGAAMRVVIARQHVMNLMITNIPGPQFPVWFMGARLLEGFPYVPLLQHTSIGVAVSSYDGRLFFGLTGDRASAPDLDVLAAGIGDALDALCDSA